MTTYFSLNFQKAQNKFSIVQEYREFKHNPVMDIVLKQLGNAPTRSFSWGGVSILTTASIGVGVASGFLLSTLAASLVATTLFLSVSYLVTDKITDDQLLLWQRLSLILSRDPQDSDLEDKITELERNQALGPDCLPDIDAVKKSLKKEREELDNWYQKRSKEIRETFDHLSTPSKTLYRKMKINAMRTLEKAYCDHLKDCDLLVNRVEQLEAVAQYVEAEAVAQHKEDLFQAEKDVSNKSFTEKADLELNDLDSRIAGVKGLDFKPAKEEVGKIDRQLNQLEIRIEKEKDRIKANQKVVQEQYADRVPLSY